MKSKTQDASIGRVLEENALLREEVRVSRRASDITANLVVEQFVKFEQILLRVEEQAHIDQELNRLQHALLGPGGLTDKLTMITDCAVRWLNADFCRIWVTRPGDRCETGCIYANSPDEERRCRQRDRCLHLLASAGRTTHINEDEYARVPFGSCGIGLLAAREDRKLVTNKAATDPRVCKHDWIQELGLVSFAGYPVRPPGGETLGIMAMFSKQIIAREQDAQLESLVNAAAQVIQSAKVAEEQKVLQRQLLQAQRLESVGHLAAGIAHEINTPTQFVSDNTRFLRCTFPKIHALLIRYRQILDVCRDKPIPSELVRELQAAATEAKLDYLLEEVPRAIGDSLEGLERVSNIVRAMKDFSHPGQQGRCMTDLNKAIQSTITVASNEWKYVAEVAFDLDPSLPAVSCLPGSMNQVFLNIIVNAAQAIADVVGDGGQGKGTITVSTRQIGDKVEIRISDTGTGIPQAFRDKIFNHFFTSKEVGKGTGQGLSLARRIVVEDHGGSITFETRMGTGTTFIIRLPIIGSFQGIDEIPQCQTACQ